MRVWLGVMWIQAGWAKLWGAENTAFLHTTGPGWPVSPPTPPGLHLVGELPAQLRGPQLGLDRRPGGGIGAGHRVRLGGRSVHPVAALGSLALLFTYVMSGTASVCAFYALFAIVILTMWKTASWIGVDGLIAGYRQRHPNLFTAHLHLPGTRGAVGTAAAHPVA